MPDSKPNILVIWGDDIGITNLSCYSDGLMGYRTPNIDRHRGEGMRFTDSYGEQSCTAGRAAFITGQSVYRTGMSKVGVPGRRHRAAAGGPDDRRAAQAARLRDRAVRQEPPGRPEQVPADRARLRRVLRQPLPPQRRGGARAAGLPRAGGVPAALRASSTRAASSTRWATDEDDDDERPEVRAVSASSASRTPARSRRSAWRRSTTRPPRRRSTSSARQHEAGHAVLRVDEHDPHAPADAHQAGEPRARPAAGSRRTTTR